ncbi:MraY family glycosyltransferase [Pseudomonas petrae]|uniref:Glycosyltransferase family 4 protein n=1 Tax=Pseudomonas petrae TaxID=2912190 RepID=A0ABS9I8S7_9PSED|nr:glycosyltransferase family 4 protein [Pseudomonas petrae]MCF7534821.1 glycosyltransferase family 4 protein [Pseudomonas petrae]MCF7539456.1 glycosyltransferase family 4 protein [Pseudomonas petrae]MCF7544152.1 glycosyltransferase family 4 protein [Pseudomonas petrae]MCF7557343.1 glycosyltransferase family 4 protein [Pseudomonas petrae]
MNYWWVAVAVVVFSFALTHVLRRYALHKSLLDVPNGRSSHTIPTPRGGGVAIVISYLVALVWMLSAGLMGRDPFLALFGAGALIAALGFLDDHGHIAARWRLLGHFFAAAWALVWLGGLPAINVFGLTLAPGLIVNVLAAFYLVWLLNLYNFMDGIDGIASVEAICVCVGAAIIYMLSGYANLVWLPVLLACAVAGFLFWNFPPAKIFMGDAGSGFLGIMLGCLSLQGAWISSQFLWVWLILLGVFIVDATVTLIRRLVRGDKVYEAHRSHAYQFASRRFGKHLPVTSAVGVINLCWLLPVAVCVTRFGLDGALGVIIAYAPLLALAVIFKAGTLEKS